MESGSYERIVRILGKSDIYDLNISFDVNKDCISIDKEKRYFFSLKKDPTHKTDVYDPKEPDEDIYKEWEYVAHGTVFEHKDLPNDKF